MKYIIVDLEMNPLNPQYREECKICRLEIIEIGAVALDENLMVLGEFKTLVCPEYNTEIQKKYETLTGISTSMVAGAPRFAKACEMFASWCESSGDEYEVYAWSENDLKQLLAEMQLKNYQYQAMDRVTSRWHDFQEEYRVKLGLERIMSLEKALDYASIAFEGQQHDVLCDARNTAELFAVVHDEHRCKEALDHVMNALKSKKISGTLGDVFDFGKLMTVRV